MEGGQDREGRWGSGACRIFFFSSIFFFFFGVCFSCTHFLHGNSCQNVVGLQRTAKLQLILEPGTGQEVRSSPASGVH